MFDKVLIANRGEIACRIMRTLHRLGIASVAVYSDADRYAPHVIEADEAIRLGGAPPAESYLHQDALIAAARASGAQAIHPGYGFLSETAAFAQACATAGVVFVGPTPEQIRDFGLKHRAREMAAAADVPLLAGTELLESLSQALGEAERIGYPVMLKSTAGGGGIGMMRVREAAAMPAAFESVERAARKNFSRGGVFLERFIEAARHIEVQIFGDGAGRVIALGERDCSVQRRNQKLIEETPAPDLPARTRQAMVAAALRLAKQVRYRSAGTVEFVYDTARGEFYFLEVNTRLQVEHGITEAVSGVDLVEWMLRVAAGDALALEEVHATGHAMEVRIYAEDPLKDFRPSTGSVTRVRFANEARVDTWIEDGSVVTPHYDPLLAKLIVRGANRGQALGALRSALAATQIAGIETNLDYLRQFVGGERFAAGAVTTGALGTFDYRARNIEVLSPGTLTTVQDLPGRIGYWDVGVPPSGPMDAWSFRLANRAVGNPPGFAGLELTLSGPSLKFHTEVLLCLAGAPMQADVDGAPIEFHVPVRVAPGSVLRIGAVRGAGCRAYLAVSGGIDVPEYMGSRSTFTLGKFGGHAGRALVAGDMLHVGPALPGRAAPPIPMALRPGIGRDWELGVLYGPHGAPDFFTEADIEQFFSTPWTVHYHSDRTGVRLIGPKPVWARQDGGEAGLHPSNIHDNAYAIGSVDFTGDMPVILGPDGPSLGGFVCPATVAGAELWKLGQLRPDDRVRFRRLSEEEALELARAQDEALEGRLVDPAGQRAAGVIARRGAGNARKDSPVLAMLPAQEGRPAAVYRRAGDANVLVEYGEPVLDLELRLRVHALMSYLKSAHLEGVLDLTPGIRSLQVHYDPKRLSQERVLSTLLEGERGLAGLEEVELATRIVHLPLSWDDPATRLAIEKYMQSVRADAPWCPSNIEFIRRINGLERIEDVRNIVFAASYLVLGLGDVYLGAPVATPLDPRHRLITTKYNPARTWTPENAVGIGGAYLCVYGMEGPGGYQFVGRTCQMWNTYRQTREFSRPWLLRFFDQIRFYPVTAAELLDFRADFAHGRARLDIHEETWRLRDYRSFLREHATDIEIHRARQRAAFDEERLRWEASGAASYAADPAPAAAIPATDELEAGCTAVSSPVTGSVWRIGVKPGQNVKAGETLVLVESMKMEMSVVAPVDGRVVELRCNEGRSVLLAQTLIILRANEPAGGQRDSVEGEQS
jgi:urea carboxylase